MWNQKRRITASEQGIPSKAASHRHLFKQNSLSLSFAAPIRLAPNWNRVLRFGNTSKFKLDEFFQVYFNISNVLQFCNIIIRIRDFIRQLNIF